MALTLDKTCGACGTTLTAYDLTKIPTLGRVCQECEQAWEDYKERSYYN